MKDWKFINNAINLLEDEYKESNDKTKFINSLIKDFVKLEDKNGQITTENRDLKAINDHLQNMNGMNTARYYAKVAR